MAAASAAAAAAAAAAYAADAPQPSQRKWHRGDASRSRMSLEAAYGGRSPRGPQRTRTSASKDPARTSPRKAPVSRPSEEVDTPRWPVRPSPARCRPSFGGDTRFKPTGAEAEILSHPTVVAYPGATLHREFTSKQVAAKRNTAPAAGALAFGPGFSRDASPSKRRVDALTEEDVLLRRLAGLRVELIDALRVLIERRMAVEDRMRGIDEMSEAAIQRRIELLERNWERLYVTPDEFRKVLPTLGVHVEREPVAAICRRLDPADSEEERTGQILLSTLDGMLRWATKMRKSAHVVHRLAEPIGGSGVGRARVALGSDATLEEQLQAAVKANPEKVQDLFLSWNCSSEGAMNRREFRHAVQMLGLKAPVAEVNLLFKSIDTNSDGSLSYKELRRGIAKRNGEIKLRRKRVGDEEVQIADFRSLRVELKAEAVKAEHNWNTNFTEHERAAYRYLLDDSCPDPDSIAMAPASAAETLAFAPAPAPTSQVGNSPRG